MVNYLKIAAGLFLATICYNTKGQQFGGNNSAIKWKQINTGPVRVIFPKGEDSTAARITDIINYLDTTTLKSIGTKRKKINLILQDRTTISNAYVGLGPFRSEFFLTPVQNSFEQGSIPWPDQLASHEFRHVQQYNNFNVGFSKVLRSVFGEEGQALANDASIPNWFFEGDAVFNETNVSKQGRGRLPYFFKDYRSLWEANANYTWMKLRNGSLKDFIPDHYALGYLLVAYGYQHYGEDFWRKVTQDAASFRGITYPFQKAIEKYSGIPFYRFRSSAIDYFKKQFDSSVKRKNNLDSRSKFTNEDYPVLLNDSTSIYVRSSFSKTPEFVLRTNNEIKKIRKKDISIDNYFTYKNGRIVYAAYQPDTRWGYQDYSDIKVINIYNGIQKRITRRGKFFSPDINYDGDKIISVKVMQGGKNDLCILDGNDGHILQELTNKQNYFYTYPKFLNDSVIISAIRNSEGKMALSLFNIKSENEVLLTPLSFNVVGFPVIKNDTVYFSSSLGMNDELMALTLQDRKLFRSNLLGAYHPSISANKLAWSTYTNKGFKIHGTEIDKIKWSQISNEDYINATSDFGITVLNAKNKFLDKIPSHNYNVSNYKRNTRLFNFHSIEPEFSDPVYTFNIIGENLLNSLQSKLSFAYDRNENYKKTALSLIYAGMYPVLSGGVSYTLDRSAILQNKLIHWNESEVFGGINLPLNLSTGRSYTFANFGSQYVFNQSNFQEGVKPRKISYSYLYHFLNISSQVQQAKQNIYPSFGQSLNVRYQHTLTNFSGQQFLMNGYVYLPGIGKNHSFVINGAFLVKDTLRQINFSSGFPFSRGYSAFNFHQMFKYGINYHLPLFYPDAGFGNIVYLLRIRSNCFYDDTHVVDYNSNHLKVEGSFRSYGTEIFFDTKWWNQAPISLGIRYSHLMDRDIYNSNQNRWELILPINIFHN